jgi:hypothetical protein
MKPAGRVRIRNMACSRAADARMRVGSIKARPIHLQPARCETRYFIGGVVWTGVRDSARSTRVQQPAKCVVQVDDRTGDFLSVFVVHHLQRGDQPALGALRLFGGERSH